LKVLDQNIDVLRVTLVGLLLCGSRTRRFNIANTRACLIHPP